MDHPIVDTTTQIGSIRLKNPVMTAAGTTGYGTEFANFFDLSQLGAVVTKSIAAFAWDGNPAPRLHPTTAGMLNAVGLQGPGLESWLANQVPQLVAAGATIVCSIWGRSVDDYRQAAAMLRTAPPEVVAVEVNLSCPNLAGHGIFAHDPDLSAQVIAATADCERPRWAKLSANTDRFVEVAGRVAQAGAEAVTAINTLVGLAIDRETLQPALANGTGGLSGRAIHPVAVRAVHQIRQAHPELPIIGVGGNTTGWDAAEMMLVGADAIQVGTACFADPRAPIKVLDELCAWAKARGIPTLTQLPRVT